ncbi:hypothetical protein EK21DRAFT_106417 [Setomelanomma holmii]|uniref:Uncharacterized protein n=1 Tax=Setomelanomma holmii TaxID=210430 RepID=A0A9P4LT59_9PLEO|nr:hypothetical protein EK21DRAFT_106417 [Setomelanomma holmii]
MERTLDTAITILGFFALASATPAKAAEIKFVFNNYCPYPLYIREAVAEHPGSRPNERCANFSESPGAKMTPGGTFTNQFPIYKDTCGYSVEVSRYPGEPVYQFEYVWALENGRVWYNLSHESDNPFTDVVRALGARRSGCPFLQCPAGDDGSACDYPHQTDCAQLDGLQGFFCNEPKWTMEMNNDQWLN